MVLHYDCLFLLSKEEGTQLLVFFCSYRTDNAVKNRFSTLCKKRAKAEALAKENNASYINLNNKRIVFQNVSTADGLSESGVPFKKRYWLFCNMFPLHK